MYIPSCYHYPCMHACSVTQSCLILCNPMDLYPTRLLCPWDFSDKNTGVGYHFLLQGIFPTQGSNPHLLCLLHCRWILYPMSHNYPPLKSFTSLFTSRVENSRMYLQALGHDIWCHFLLRSLSFPGLF